MKGEMEALCEGLKQAESLLADGVEKVVLRFDADRIVERVHVEGGLKKGIELRRGLSSENLAHTPAVICRRKLASGRGN